MNKPAHKFETSRTLAETINGPPPLRTSRDLQDAPGKSSGPGFFGVVISADKQDAPAAYEVEQVQRLGFKDVVFYKRQGFLRTVARFPDRSTAENVLPEIQKYRQTAHLINLEKWCSNPHDSAEKISGITVFTCQ